MKKYIFIFLAFTNISFSISSLKHLFPFFADTQFSYKNAAKYSIGRALANVFCINAIHYGFFKYQTFRNKRKSFEEDSPKPREYRNADEVLVKEHSVKLIQNNSRQLEIEVFLMTLLMGLAPQTSQLTQDIVLSSAHYLSDYACITYMNNIFTKMHDTKFPINKTLGLKNEYTISNKDIIIMTVLRFAFLYIIKKITGYINRARGEKRASEVNNFYILTTSLSPYQCIAISKVLTQCISSEKKTLFFNAFNSVYCKRSIFSISSLMLAYVIGKYLIKKIKMIEKPSKK